MFEILCTYLYLYIYVPCVYGIRLKSASSIGESDLLILLSLLFICAFATLCWGLLTIVVLVGE